MGKDKNWIVLVLLFWGWNCIAGSPVLNQEKAKRDKLVNTAESQLFVREKTGHNDGKEVEEYLRVTGLGKGNAWCAAFLAWDHVKNNISSPHSAFCPDWFKSHVVYSQFSKTIEPFISQPGQVFGLYFESKGRIAHVGMITGETRFSYNTIEGNTNDAGSREGDGVYRKIRNKRQINKIADYVK